MRWPLLASHVEHEDDIVTVRQRVRRLAESLGFEVQDQTRIATAVSEIARNAYGYAGGGRVEYGLDEEDGGQSLVIRVIDTGPGIPHLDEILEGRYRSTTGLGIGITGSRRLMDRFEIETEPGKGTVATFAKRLPSGTESFTGKRLATLAEDVARARTEEPLVALREQNRELLRSLAELAERQEEAERLNRELAETNRGVVALHAELEDQAERLREAGASLETQVAARTAELAEANARLLAEAVERERMEQDLRQSQKLEAVGQLTGGVAHDFNNLLTIIRSSVDFLRRPDLPEERRKRYMDAVSDTVDRAAKLTGQLLAFARRQSLRPEVFDAGERLRGVADMLDTITGARIRVKVEASDAVALVRADVNQFETAVVNAAVNARDAMDGVGTLTMRVLAGQPMPSIRGHGGARGPFVAISLTDTGSGIPIDVLGRIFEPFFTTKAVGRGTGLGLSQVFGFAKQSGGDVDVSSAVGEGTTFTLYLPEVSDGPAEMPIPDPDIGVAPSGQGQPVLLVEDNLEVGRFCAQILEDLGYAPEWVVNAEEALERLGADGGGFRAVFSDVVMPGMGGIELAKALRIRLPNLPVVLASGYSHVLAREDSHGFELLHKPYSAAQIGKALRRVIAAAPAGGRGQGLGS
ncbi:Anti-sigma F factor [Methylobacterium adhaesivum]|uniref:histidine kinase n=1 Tax=Methylobacterium adhaesivum TaxID=333297 RepID=A0ABT8BMS5_9HYPH|nr:ATP-binding protein [Methylobacterium adhaesivum]MDN3593143.1 ATP-binding protein [Methylobacterium adhaesivum]GJD32436.1 Anti-sigma F factor [Methylobacterium adhaesivum]